MDRIVTSRPANKTAALVTGKGVHWEPAKQVIKATAAWSDLPLPTIGTPKEGPQLTGRKVGRLVVIGYAGSRSSGARWVVRCACGMFGHQRSKFLLSENAKVRGMCPKCDYLEEIKAGRFHEVFS